MIGGYDKGLLKNDLKYHKVVKKTWWTLRLTKVIIGGVDTKFCNKKDKICYIIIDTGASLMATPP